MLIQATTSKRTELPLTRLFFIRCSSSGIGLFDFPIKRPENPLAILVATNKLHRRRTRESNLGAECSVDSGPGQRVLQRKCGKWDERSVLACGRRETTYQYIGNRYGRANNSLLRTVLCC